MEKWKKVKLGDLLEEYCERNVNQEYKVVAVGKYGIRKREDIYSKELSKDISKNKIIMKNTLTIGMGSNQIDIGILTEDKKFCVSPAYTTYKIKNCNSQFLEYYLQFLNPKLSDLFMVISARQGKSVDKEGLLKYEIYIPPLDQQTKIVEILKKVDSIIDKYDKLLKEKNQFIKSQFVEMFGDIQINEKKWEEKNFFNLCQNMDNRRKPISASVRAHGIYPYYGASGIVDYVDSYIFDENLLLISEDGANLTSRVTPIAFSIEGKNWVNNHAHVLRFEDFIIQKYVEFYFSMININKYLTGTAQPKLNQAKLNSMVIPIPDYELIQKFVKINKQIEEQKSLLEKQVENYKRLKKALMQQLLTEK